MADDMVEPTRRLRFFCHRCRIEFPALQQENICPYCEGGFIEQLESRSGLSERGTTLSSENYSDADMSNIDDMELDVADEFTLRAPSVLSDLALLMSGRRMRNAVLNAVVPNGPVNGTNAPANGTNNRANGPNGPANGTNAPANGTNAPANGTNVPATGTHAPANGTNAPADGTNAPANGTSGPANGTNPPDGGTNGPASGTATAPTGGNTNNTGNRNPVRATLIEELLWMIGGARAPPGTVTAGTPLVLLGTPGDYVFGGEGLDAVVTQLMGQLEHSGPPPLPRERLAALPVEQVGEERAASHTACSVCWDNYQLGETIMRLECEHVFHQTCITPWLELHATCPICRRSLLPPTNPNATASPLANPVQPPNPPNSGNPATTTTATTTAATVTPSTFPFITTNSGPQAHITLRRGQVTSVFVNAAPQVVIQRRAPGHIPASLFRYPLQTHTWDPLNNTSSSGSPASSVTTGGIWATPNRSSNSTGSTNSSSSLNSSDRDRQYNTDIDYD